MTGRWVDSLPEPAPAVWDPARLQVSALQWLVSALDAHDSGQAETCAVRLGWAGARIRAWRLTLPDQAPRMPLWPESYTSDRDLILAAICACSEDESDLRPVDLRRAECYLRTIWHRGQS